MTEIPHLAWKNKGRGWFYAHIEPGNFLRISPNHSKGHGQIPEYDLVHRVRNQSRRGLDYRLLGTFASKQAAMSYANDWLGDN